jgi:hypothetical protein
MADTHVGDTTKLIINEQWLFGIGATGSAEFYDLKNILSLRLSRPVTRRAILAGPSLTYGAGDHHIEIEIEADTVRLKSLLDLNKRDSSGKMTIKIFTLQSTDLAGVVEKIQVSGIAAEVEVTGTGNDGRLLVKMRIDVTTDHPTFPA